METFFAFDRREIRSAASFLRKELGEALRIGPKDSGLTA